MSTEIEDDLKVGNWLSMMTFDAFRYVKAGGQLIVRSSDNGIVIEIPDVNIDNENINKKFRKLVAAETVELA